MLGLVHRDDWARFFLDLMAWPFIKNWFGLFIHVCLGVYAWLRLLTKACFNDLVRKEYYKDLHLQGRKRKIIIYGACFTPIGSTRDLWYRHHCY